MIAKSGDGRPVIGLTVEVLDAPFYDGRRRYQLFTDYLDCLRAAGAHPVLLPGDAAPQEADRWFDLLDGLLLTGGDDVDLRALGGPAPTEECKPVPQEQQVLNLHLVSGACARELPVFGICLGMQMMGLAHRAPYIQHLPDPAAHEKGRRHGVRVAERSLLARLVGEREFPVASFHHQALEGPGNGLRASAWADDGTLEAVEHPDHPFALGVQWHPERTPDAPQSRALFSGFVAAARSYGYARK